MENEKNTMDTLRDHLKKIQESDTFSQCLHEFSRDILRSELRINLSIDQTEYDKALQKITAAKWWNRWFYELKAYRRWKQLMITAGRIYFEEKDQLKAGDFLVGIPSSEESEEYHPEGERVFIYSGHKSADGYGKLIGFNDHQIKHSSGWNNFMWGADVRKATPKEIENFMSKVMNTEIIKHY